MERFDVFVPAESAGQRADRFLADLEEIELTRSALQRLFEQGLVQCGEKPVAKNLKLKAGDHLTVDLPDAKPLEAQPQNIPLEIVYEDDYLLVVNKPAGMTAHASNFLPDTPTVAGALAWQRGTNFVFHPVNRLDKGTTGLMVIAKSGYIHDRLRYALHTERFCREYRAVCIGCPDPKSGTIDAPIGRDPNSVVGRCVRPDGARAVTHYEVLGRSNGLSLLRLRPETGRTHQLRVHMASIGCPLAGDWLYGEEDPDLIPRPALHAYALDLDHPVTGEHLSLTAPIPADMARLAPELLTETECASEEI